MNTFEKFCTTLRHTKILRNQAWLWRPLATCYDRFLVFAFGTLKRTINMTDTFVVPISMRCMTGVYEPELWDAVSREIRPTDRFLDIGGFWGLYSGLVGRIVAQRGQVICFEPSDVNRMKLVEFISVNGLSAVVHVEATAVTDYCGTVHFNEESPIESHISNGGLGRSVPCTTIDDYIRGRRVDVVKIDVEGFEVEVIRGAASLLRNPSLAPRTIFIEVHPFAWCNVEASWSALQKMLSDVRYVCTYLNGDPILGTPSYGHIVARKHQGDA